MNVNRHCAHKSKMLEDKKALVVKKISEILSDSGAHDFSTEKTMAFVENAFENLPREQVDQETQTEINPEAPKIEIDKKLAIDLMKEVDHIEKTVISVIETLNKQIF